MDKVHELLHQQTTETPFFVVGKAFFGKKNISQKDGSYTATLWMTFFNIPFYPIDSYRILNTEHNLLPKVYGIGEYILIRSVQMKFDISQVVWTFIVVYGSMILLSYLDIYLFIEYGPAHGYGFLAAVIGTYASILVWNHKTLNASPRMEVKHVPKVEKVEVAQPTEVVLEESSFAPVSFEPTLPKITVEQTVASKPVKRSLESIIAPPVSKPEPVLEPMPIIRPEPIIEKAPLITPPTVPAAVHIDLDSDEPKFELAPPALDKHIKVPKPSKKSRNVEKHDMPSFSPVPQPIMSVAESKPVAAATISQSVTLPGQVKFDPNKIMEWNPADIDMHPAKILYPHDHMRFADWIALLLVISLLGQLIIKFYFILYPVQTGDMAVFQTTFELLYDLYFLSVFGVILFVFTVRNSPYLAYPLLFLSFAYFFRLEQMLFNFLLSL